jgi:hypothetical protein
VGRDHPWGTTMRRFIATSALLAMLLLPQPTVAAAPSALSLRFTVFQSPVQRSKTTSVTVHTGANVRCSIRVTYQNGPSSASGLGAKYANALGNVTWRWTVPAKTAPGTWPVSVTCQSGSKSGSVSRGMQITR